MGSVGDAYDNAMAESFFSTLEAELLSRRRFASQAEARMACFSYIEGWYNPVRLHSSLGYRSPMTYEAEQEPVTSTTSFPCPQTVHQDRSIPLSLGERHRTAEGYRLRCQAVSWLRPPPHVVSLATSGSACPDRGEDNGFHRGSYRCLDCTAGKADGQGLGGSGGHFLQLSGIARSDFTTQRRALAEGSGGSA